MKESLITFSFVQSLSFKPEWLVCVCVCVNLGKREGLFNFRQVYQVKAYAYLYVLFTMIVGVIYIQTFPVEYC